MSFYMHFKPFYFSGKASQNLKQYDNAIDYFKKALKLNMKIKDVKKVELLGCYENLLQAQVKSGNFQAAKKTVERIKLYNLNSTVTTDLDLGGVAAEVNYNLHLQKIIPYH